MFKVVLVDRDYGSVTLQSQEDLKNEYAKNGIKLSLNHFTNEEELIENCKDAEVLLYWESNHK